MDEYIKLLKEWCDRIISLQIIHKNEPTMHGAVFCPSCSRVHGRFADAVYPMILLYDKFGDEKYLICAERMIDWSEYNLLTSEGGYNNDKEVHWPETTVFSGMALGNALLHHGSCLNKKTYNKLYDIFVRLSSFVYCYFDSPEFSAHINYPVTEAGLMAMAYVLTKDEKYREKAFDKMEFAKKYFNDENMLIGEGVPYDFCSKKRCNYIDIGYNVEESLPALTECAHLLGDRENLEFFAKAFRSHIEFMLPDGGWDNSIGSRAYKWTYWGSRTSDGCQEGLVHISHLDPVFGEAIQRNFGLYREHTHDGLLYGGKMLINSNEEPCVHHTFCHAKAVAAMIDSGFVYKEKTTLPREKEYGIKHIKSVGALLVSKGEWRATVSESDAIVYKGGAVSGGTMSLLWHKKAGVLLAGVRENYWLQEHANMQNTRNWAWSSCCSVRLLNGRYSSMNDIHAECDYLVFDDRIEVCVKGVLRDEDFNGSDKYFFTYVFRNDKVTVRVESAGENKLMFPVIVNQKDFREVDDNHFVIVRNGVEFNVKSNCSMNVPASEFSMIGGFEFIPLYCGGNAEIEITMKV